MAILWCGGEDIDFSQGGVAPSVDTTSGHRRTTFSREAIGNAGVINSSVLGMPFSGGPVTSLWVSCRLYTGSKVASSAGRSFFGVGRSGTTGWLVIGAAAAGNTKLALQTHIGTTLTELATESGASISADTLLLIQMQVVNYGASATVNVYVNGSLVISFTGDVTVSGVTDLDEVVIPASQWSSTLGISEVIVADEDVRAFPGLATLALTGAGTTDEWTGAFGGINGVTISDTTPNFTNITAKDQQYNWTDLPAGSFVIKAVKVAARMAKSASPAVTQVKLGYNSGGSVAFGTGATKALTTAYETYEQIDAQNPVTAADWAQADMNALQVDAQSLT